jgi:MFS family permease
VSRVVRVADRTFHSLRNRNYRLYFLGQVVSLSGTWMQSVAQSWLVLKLTGSAVDLGLVTALQFLPILLAGPWGGVLADRVDKRKLIIGTQTAQAALALVLGVLTVTGAVELWMVYVLAAMLGVATLVDMPARQAFVMEMVGPADLTNAVSLNGVIVNASRVVGPAVAGIVIATIGIGLCFLLNAASFIAVIISLFLMRPADLVHPARAVRGKGMLREGLVYAWRVREIRWSLMIMAVVGTLAFNFSVLLPLLARFTFSGGAQIYGALFSLMGVGAVVGGLIVAGRNRATPLLLGGSAAMLGVSLGLAAAAPNLAVELVAMIPIGMSSTAFIATSNALLQLRSLPEMRGRVMALFSMVFLGSTPIGGLGVGWIAEVWGPRAGLWVGGVASAVAGLVAVVAARRGTRTAQDEETKIGSLVGASLPPAGSTVTASRSTS